MGYDIRFKAKVEGVDYWVKVSSSRAIFPKSKREALEKMTGFSWMEGVNCGLCVDVIPIIKRTFDELCANPRIYEPRETQNFWGDVEMLQHFFWWILHDWEDFKKEYPELVSVVTFWIY